MSCVSAPLETLSLRGRTGPSPIVPSGVAVPLQKLPLIPFLTPFVPTKPPITSLLRERHATIISSFFGPSVSVVLTRNPLRDPTLRPILTSNVRQIPVRNPRLVNPGSVFLTVWLRLAAALTSVALWVP